MARFIVACDTIRHVFAREHSGDMVMLADFIEACMTIVTVKTLRFAGTNKVPFELYP